jgi:hypothetical protein
MVNRYSGVINNGGTISSTGSLGQLENGGHITNSGSIGLGENGMTNDASGIITNNNAGMVTFDNTNNYGTINNLGNVVSKGLVNWGTGAINNNGGGNFTTFIGGITNYGTINNNSGGNFNDRSGIANYNTINNNSGGNFTNNNGITNYNTINNRGTFANYGGFSNIFDNISLHFGIVNNYGMFKNFGTFNNDEYINNFSFFKNTASGSIANSGFINNICHGVLTNLGAISGNPVNNFPCNTTLTPDKDSYIVHDLPNANYGANTLLKIQQVKQMRTTISFDFSPLETIKVLQAKLRIFATSNGFNWGSGESIEAHKLTSNWTEGNGIDAIIRGTGSGVTWSCPIDSNITNQRFDCNSQWNGGSFVAIPTGIVSISNTTSGIWLEFNVTNDVNSFLDGNAADNSGWIIKKTNEQTSGSIAFASRENSDTVHRPQLVLKFGS